MDSVGVGYGPVVVCYENGNVTGFHERRRFSCDLGSQEGLADSMEGDSSDCNKERSSTTRT